nr:hypothetical protein Iba_chr03bCG15690 [Ipomoea batatas]
MRSDTASICFMIPATRLCHSVKYLGRSSTLCCHLSDTTALATGFTGYRPALRHTFPYFTAKAAKTITTFAFNE